MRANALMSAPNRHRRGAASADPVDPADRRPDSGDCPDLNGRSRRKLDRNRQPVTARPFGANPSQPKHRHAAAGRQHGCDVDQSICLSDRRSNGENSARTGNVPLNDVGCPAAADGFCADRSPPPMVTLSIDDGPGRGDLAMKITLQLVRRLQLVRGTH